MENKTIIISGANGNVGSYFAKKLITQNRLILPVHRNQDRIQSLEKEKNAAIFNADITNYQEIKEKIEQIITTRAWQPDALIHTASVRSSDFASLLDSKPEKWLEVINVNLLGTYNILKTVLPFFQKAKYGRILLFGSNVSRIGLKNGSAYAASKAAIANICRSLSAEIGESNILINTLSPGPIKIDDSKFSEQYRQFRETYYAKETTQIPLQRVASIQDLYEISTFLISDKNSYLTGEEIFLTGGKL